MRVDELRQQVVQKFGVTLPTDYISDLEMEMRNPNTSERIFSFSDKLLGEVRAAIGPLLSPDKEQSENIWKVQELAQGRLPAFLFPFALTGGGDLVCFDTRKRELPVCIWQHDRDGDEATVELAKSYSAFRAKLEKSEDDDFQW